MLTYANHQNGMISHSPTGLSLRPFAWLFLLFWLSLSARAASTSTNADYEEGNVLVRFNSLQTDADIQALAGRHNANLKHHFHSLSAHDGKSLCLLHSDTKSTAALIAELRAEPGVAYVEPDYRRHVMDMRTPNDAYFGQLWGLHNTGQSILGENGTSNADISFLKAWGLARPSTSEVVVAVIDTGLDITHPDIVSNLWTNPGLNDGYSGDLHGYDFALNTGALTDSGFHGTHVCGTIAATGNNGIGVIGVDFTAHVMMLKVSTDGENIISSDEISALDYIATVKNLGVNVVAVNASYGGGSDSSSESSAISAIGSEGVIFCAAAGNNSADNDTTGFYPADYRLSNMIVVAASDQNDALASFSNYGASTVDLAAPGVDIFSLLPMNLIATNADVLQSNALYSAEPMLFAGATPTNGITGAVYYCNLGNPTDFPAAVTNNIALIQRGTLTFAVKVQNAMAAGAKAAIIFNNIPGNFSGTLGSAGNWIPAVSLSQSDGQTLQATLPSTATVFNGPEPSLHYQFLSGTSMATPHVVGAVAFAALNFPTETVAQRIQRVITNTTPVADLAGLVASGGRLNLAKIVDTDGNGLPDWWEQQYFGHLTGTDPNADPDHDGENNLAEFLAGTIPTNALSVFKLNNPPAAKHPQYILQWPSVAGRYYNVLRYTNLLTGPGILVQMNITATPPLNLFTDTPPANVKNTFYRLQLEP
jgi:subtilisin family serine protease